MNTCTKYDDRFYVRVTDGSDGSDRFWRIAIYANENGRPGQHLDTRRVPLGAHQTAQLAAARALSSCY